ELRFLALLDIHADTDHAQGDTVGIALDHAAALEQPAPTAHPVTDAVFRIVVIGFAGDVITEPPRSNPDIVRMNVGIPARHMLLPFAGIQIEPIAPVAVPAGVLGAEVQLPQAHAGAPYGRFQPCLGGA